MNLRSCFSSWLSAEEQIHNLGSFVYVINMLSMFVQYFLPNVYKNIVTRRCIAVLYAEKAI